jgi:hypothetical protein
MNNKKYISIIWKKNPNYRLVINMLTGFQGNIAHSDDVRIQPDSEPGITSVLE